MSENGYQLSERQKMLGIALFARKVSRAVMTQIMMVLETDDQIDDMTWYMSENPKADEKELVAVAYQIVKEAHDN